MTAAFDPATLPRKRVGAGVLLRNEAGQVLLVEPTYKEFWEIPGGIVEVDESPREAAVRECMEELGVELSLGMAVCVDYSPRSVNGDGIMFVFDAGVTQLGVEDFQLPPDELRSAKFVEPSDFAQYLKPIMVTRMLTAIIGAAEQRTIYLDR